MELAGIAELMGVELDEPAVTEPVPTPAYAAYAAPALPEVFEVGRNGKTRATADHLLEIEAIKAVVEPDPTPGAMVLLSSDSVTGTVGIMPRVNAWRAAQGHGGKFSSGNVNGILRGVFGLVSRQKNFCARADCRRVCTRANCGAHYHPDSRTRFTVVEGVRFI